MIYRPQQQGGMQFGGFAGSGLPVPKDLIGILVALFVTFSRFWLLLVRAAIGAALVAVVVQFFQGLAGVGASGAAAFQLMQGQRILLAIVIAAFATMWGEATILLFFVLPIKARWFLWLEILFAFIGFLESKDFAGFCGVSAAVFLTYTGLKMGGAGGVFHNWRKRGEAFILQKRLERLRKKRQFDVIDGDKDEYIH